MKFIVPTILALMGPATVWAEEPTNPNPPPSSDKGVLVLTDAQMSSVTAGSLIAAGIMVTGITRPTTLGDNLTDLYSE